jgi:hypothetical protein
MKNKSMLRVLALVVVLSMIFTTAAFASPGNKKMSRDEESYKVAVESLIEKEIMKGYGHGDYGIEGNVKRGDVIVMIVRAFDLEIETEDLVTNFLDVADEDDYFYGPVNVAKRMGIAKGDGKYFKPNKPVTVQEAIWLIERAEDLVDNDDLDIEEEDLDILFEEDELGKFAKRKDIALMLHFMMTGENDYEDDKDGEDDVEDDEIDDIKFEIDEDEVLNFTSDSNSDKTIEEILKGFESDIEYVKFDLPVKNGTLYYDYDVDDSEDELVTESIKYYLDGSDDDLLDEITFVPKNDFNGTVNISYNAYADEDEFSGKIVITVGNDEEELENLALIKYTMDENTEKEFVENSLNSNMDEVKFAQPDEDEGTLYIDIEDDEEVDEDEFYTDEEFGQVTFVPAQDFTGKVDIKYIAKDGEVSYSGVIRITVKEVQEISAMEIEIDEDDDLTNKIINFEDALDDLTDSEEIFTQNVYEAIDHIKFEYPSQGKLMIDLSGDGDGYKNVIAGTEYHLNEIIGLKYIPVDGFDSEDEMVTIEFTAVDENKADKEYNGVIEITVVD